MITYLLFDLDGTLTNPQEGITKCVQHALRAFGIEEPDLEKLIPFIGPPLIQSFMEFYNMSEEDARKAVAVYRERFSTVGLFENFPYPGIADMLAELKAQGKILAVASSKPTIYVRRILEKFELAPYFDVVEGSNLDGTRVDKKEVIAEVLSQLDNPSADDLLMIGDRKFDVIGARETGFGCVGVRFGFAAPDELEQSGAVYIADTVHDLHRYLLNI
ncbi:MAG: HAD family hydrolase [Peptococcaceae bacterium]|nr:HAD family hydrolase [Peptococcaceae bacterium]MBQ5702528.1 HAD family hydrolase [Peptococcaceae bacterium]